MGTLEQAWKQCFRDIGGSEPPPCVWEELRARYSETHRAYHTLQHLNECFAWFNQAKSLTTRPGEVAFALFYHDAIYDTHAPDNEEKSAQLAAEVLEEYVRGDGDARMVWSLILATKHSALPVGPDAEALVDIDLSILGASMERFDEYEEQIRAEYAWIAPSAYREGRRRVLQQFLERPAIFSTGYFRDRLELPARANLERSIAALQAS